MPVRSKGKPARAMSRSVSNRNSEPREVMTIIGNLAFSSSASTYFKPGSVDRIGNRKYSAPWSAKSSSMPPAILSKAPAFTSSFCQSYQASPPRSSPGGMRKRV